MCRFTLMTMHLQLLKLVALLLLGVLRAMIIIQKAVVLPQTMAMCRFSLLNMHLQPCIKQVLLLLGVLISLNSPKGDGYTAIYSTRNAFAALKADGSITSWGNKWYGGSGAPTENGYVQIFSNDFAFAALNADGSITSWGGDGPWYKWMNVKLLKSKQVRSIIVHLTVKVTRAIYSTYNAFAALHEDGSIYAWGDNMHGRLCR